MIAHRSTRTPAATTRVRVRNGRGSTAIPSLFDATIMRLPWSAGPTVAPRPRSIPTGRRGELPRTPQPPGAQPARWLACASYCGRFLVARCAPVCRGVAASGAVEAGVRRTTPSRRRTAACSSWPDRLSSRLVAGTAGSRASRAINPSTTVWASRSTSGSTVRTGWSGSCLEEPVKEPTRDQLLSDAQSWDDGPGVERHVARDRQGWSNVACAAASLRSMPTGGRADHRGHRGYWDRPARPKLGVRPAAPSHGEPRSGASPARPRRDTAGGVARAAPGLVRCGLPRHVAACSRRGEIAGSTGNLQQAARVADWTTLLLAEERARRPGWSGTSGRQGSSPRQGLQDQGRQHGRVGPMREIRRRFHEELRALEGEVQRTGTQAKLLLERALQALARGDPAVCEEVIRGDDEVDQLYLDVERRILGLFALQTPVASDLRLLTALLHINLHLERIADQAVNLAKLAKLVHGLPQNPNVLRRLEEMGAIALGMVTAAMDALARRDLDLARQLPEMDDPIDRLNRGMLQEVLEGSADRRVLEWGIRMHLVSRQIERIGDNAVDIGEQVAFLVTGEFHEFTDASHPEIEHSGLLERGLSPNE